MKKFKVTIISIFISLFVNISFAADEKDCSSIKKNTGAGWLKSALCKRGSDKLDDQGNFKKGTFNIFKKLKKS